MWFARFQIISELQSIWSKLLLLSWGLSAHLATDWCHWPLTCVRYKYQSSVSNVLFIPFFVFGFWSLLVTKLLKYINITLSLFTFCKVRWKRWKKTEGKSRKWRGQNTKRQKTKIWDERNMKLSFMVIWSIRVGPPI